MTNTAPLIGMIAAITLGFANQAFAENKHGHGAEQGHAEETAQFEKPTFGNVKDAWTFMTAKVSEVESLLSENKVEPVHKIGEELEGAIHTLEEKSDAVTAEAKPKLASVLKQLDKAVDDLHHSAEANDAPAANLHLKKIKGLLPLVESLYPAATLK